MTPFRGVTERPYDQATLADIDRRAMPPVRVAFAELWLTQTHLKVAGLFGERYSRDPHPHVVRYAGNLYVEDGHHRLVLAALAGARSTLARIIDL